ncbi:hypothetical protein HPC49_43485 [Pyxidicoccus fallax]|uniref:Uncharacterized protein n=1 Tax=Pyxidicoccus fallax TaxID=394095 RepID=A0A848LDJ6_9BACT|nr:hypothetical protein [Pyxidicoccus fallax]NMO17160.1 hypothetical protein [Pyxidicoccus fallax]NPC85068.1 hypothetical protein [Pyxidicoccus fallax]
MAEATDVKRLELSIKHLDNTLAATSDPTVCVVTCVTVCIVSCITNCITNCITTCINECTCGPCSYSGSAPHSGSGRFSQLGG